MVETVEKPGEVVARARETVASRTVFIRATGATGVFPMERRLPDGSKNVSTCDHNISGQMINKVMVRPLDFGSNGVMPIDPRDPDDAALLAECRLWLAQGDDPRLSWAGISIQEGEGFEAPPIPLYEKRKPDALIGAMSDHLDLIADDPEACRVFLESCARYELQREKPRKKVLDAIDDLGVASGVEYGTDAVEESD